MELNMTGRINGSIMTSGMNRTMYGWWNEWKHFD